MSREAVLVNADWVEQHIDDPKVVLVEVDEDTTAYDKGHIKGAIKLDWSVDLQDQVRRDAVNKDQFAALLSERGIGNEDTVILYGGNNNWFAAYAYWYFKLYGHQDVKLLDGGRKKWELDSRELVDENPTREKTNYVAQEQDLSIRAFRDEVVEAIGVKNLIDGRSPDEYAGRSLAPAHLPQEQAQRAGHIPTARNVPWSKAANDDGTFKSDDELKALYTEAGVDWDKETITYGRIGERSAHTWFVLRGLLEQPNVKNYSGSWYEYGSLVGVPIVLGDAAGETWTGLQILRTGYRPETLAVHAGQEEADPATNARAVPIYQTTSYVFNDTEHAANLFSLSEPGNIYTRIGNPTQSVFEDRMAQLEGGVGALATASGSAATTYAVLNLTCAGDNIVALSTLYGGTYALFAHTLPQFGIEVRFVDPDKPDELANAVDDKTRLVFAETIGNPKINVVDIKAWANAAHAQGLPLIVDNTAPTPLLCKPFELGADVVVHAATKYIGGHGTSIGGVIVDSGNFDWAAHADRFPGLTRPDAAYHGAVWTEAVGNLAYIIRARTVLLRNTGAAIAPLNSWLFLQGLETLHLRMERHSENALKVARFLDNHDAVSWVSYPGLDDNEYKPVADRTLLGRGYGGLVSFGVKSGREGGKKFIEALQLISHLANIGDTKSLAIHNATTTHSQLTPDELEAAGVAEDMVRLSVGIEHVEDITADLEQALAASK